MFSMGVGFRSTLGLSSPLGILRHSDSETLSNSDSVHLDNQLPMALMFVFFAPNRSAFSFVPPKSQIEKNAKTSIFPSQNF